MKSRYLLAPQAAADLVEIWRYVKEHASSTMANRIEAAIRERMAFLARTPGAGHRRKDLTEEDVKFFPVYSYLIVYRAETEPLQIVSFFTGVVTSRKFSKTVCDELFIDATVWRSCWVLRRYAIPRG
jgi:antitoxin ParD1/3/4/toxin ParE1/3/4